MVSEVLGLLGLLVASYLLGGIPFGYLYARFVKGVDIRTIGSGNVGATNVARLYPPRAGILVFLIVFTMDAGKGYAAVELLAPLIKPAPAAEYVPVLAGLAAVLGHSFTPYLGFSGGKAVATTFGVFIALDPVATLVALGVFFVVYAITRAVGAGSVAFAVALPVAVFVHGEAHQSVGYLAVVLGILIVVRHRDNIRKMLGKS